MSEWAVVSGPKVSDEAQSLIDSLSSLSVESFTLGELDTFCVGAGISQEVIPELLRIGVLLPLRSQDQAS